MFSSKSTIALGIMSGTSLDGLDIAACKFWEENNKWEFEILDAETFEYSSNELAILKNVFNASGVDLILLHHLYGNLIGKKAKLFCDKHHLKPNFIASHGHTIFHQPNNKLNFFNLNEENETANGFTFQLGHGANIAAQSGINTVCDFRTSDIAFGGQGAPLVPIGDELLFSEYHYCLNLGGISNISFNKNGIRNAFDIGICNMALNELAQQAHLDFDKDGILAQSGTLEDILLLKLFEINHLKQHSLGFEWYIERIKPILNSYPCSIENKLRTYCEFIAKQIAAFISKNNNVLVTGGGAKNKFLMACIQEQTHGQIIIPKEQLIDFKEALIFAFLGLLRINHQSNSLSKVTGATKNAIGGCVYLA